jgi:hypothetical protein
MEPRECFYQERFGYCWLDHDQWQFQPVDQEHNTIGEPLPVKLLDVKFHHEEDEQE